MLMYGQSMRIYYNQTNGLGLHWHFLVLAERQTLEPLSYLHTGWVMVHQHQNQRLHLRMRSAEVSVVAAGVVGSRFGHRMWVAAAFGAELRMTAAVVAPEAGMIGYWS